MVTHMAAGRIGLKRAYPARGYRRAAPRRAAEPPEPGDGTRILIDRLWPRGIKKTEATIDRWLRDVAPSAELRRWFAHRPER